MDLKNTVDSALTIPLPKFMVAFDLSYDDAVSDAATADERMRHYGCFPETVDTKVTSPDPYIGIVSPDGNIWKLSVDNAGVLTTIKVT